MTLVSGVDDPADACSQRWARGGCGAAVATRSGRAREICKFLCDLQVAVLEKSLGADHAVFFVAELWDDTGGEYRDEISHYLVCVAVCSTDFRR